MSAQVLIIEDEALLAANLSKALARCGVTADVAHSLAEAGRRLTASDYGLVCADIQLGDGNGLEFCEELRAQKPELPVVMMTGQDSSGNRLRAEGLGAMAFMAKPFPLARFRELVATLLQEHLPGPFNASAARGPRVLMYSHDTIGLGHMRRNSAIAAHIVERNPKASVLMLVGSPAGVVFDLPPGIDYVKLPSLSKVARDIWRPQSLRLSSTDTVTLRSSLIERAVESFAPDVVLVDHEPGGIGGELLPALSALRRSCPATRVILGLRDILDEPSRTRSSWDARGIRHAIANLYDDILIYGEESVFPTRNAYGLDGLVRGDIAYCGYVTAIAPSSRVAYAASDKGEKKPQIAIAGGGGRDAFSLLVTAAEALASMSPVDRPNADIIAGPLLDAELRAPLEQKVKEAGARYHDRHTNIPALLRDADLFVTMGGYNSLVEAVTTGCPALIVPRVGPSAEQRMRAERFTALGLAETLPAAEATASRLATRFSKVGAGAPRNSPAIDINGSARAASFIEARLSVAAASRASSEWQVIHA